GKIQAMAVIAGLHAGTLLRFSQLLQPLGGAVAAEGVPPLDQLVTMFAVEGAPLALPIRRMRSANVGPFVPAQAEPSERSQYHCLGGGRGPGLVGVLDAQQKLAAVLLRKAIIKQGHVGRADMRIPGR